MGGFGPLIASAAICRFMEALSWRATFFDQPAAANALQMLEVVTRVSNSS